MTDLIIRRIAGISRGSRVLILGFGREGRATYNLLTRAGLHELIDIADINPPDDIAAIAPDSRIYSGADYLDYMDEYDLAIKSPGIVLPRDAQDYKCIITSQTEMFMRYYRNQIIGITGTKGKSTVSSLLYHVLSENGIICVLAGNIGTPVFDTVGDIDPETVVILELSCHQLEICDVSPAVSVLLNIFEDHLDHYKTFEDYRSAKENIYRYQKPLDMLYCSESAVPDREDSIFRSRTVVVGDGGLTFGSLENLGGIRLRGRHNFKNCAFVYEIAKTFGVTEEAFIASLRTYRPLPHRLEFIGSVDGVDYYDDSISTTAESAMSAVESVDNASTLIIGGRDRGISYAGLAHYISVSGLLNVICMYKSGKRIYEILKTARVSKPCITYCGDLHNAVRTAKKLTPPGTACILSPAAASYGNFKNFEERGDKFRQLVFDTGI